VFEIFEGQLLPDIADKITVGGNAFVLTSPAVTGVTFSMRRPWDTTLAVDHQAAAIVDPTTGSVQYVWKSGDTDDPGDYLYWWTVTMQSGKSQDTPEGSLRVLAHSPSTDLITADDVLLSSQIPAALQPDPSPLIEFYIALASNRIMSEYGHVRPYETDVTKRLTVRRNRVRFFPYFLESASAVVLSPESWMRTLDVTVPDYQLEPFVTLEGCYTGMRTSPWIPHVSPTQMRFGRALIDVTGNWGYQIVPDAVRLGTLVAVRSWMLRDAASYSDVVLMSDPSILPRPSGTYALPLASREHLDLFAQTAGVT
jgi:hypothetical protein